MQQELTTGEMLQLNWNRISYLSRKRLDNKLNDCEKLELRYRTSIQNDFSSGNSFNRKSFIIPERYV